MYDYDMTLDTYKFMKEQVKKIMPKTILGFPNRPVYDCVMIMLCLGLDAFSESWHSGLRFP
jgi:hypothetical protein